MNEALKREKRENNSLTNLEEFIPVTAIIDSPRKVSAPQSRLPSGGGDNRRSHH